MLRHCLVVAAGLPLTGCAASATYNHTDPAQVSIENETTINETFDEVWDTMIANLAKSFFVINNVDKTSRIMNVSFSADQPAELIDCGFTNRTFKQGNRSESYSYKTTDRAHYLTAGPAGQLAEVQRSTALEGRANIYVAPKDQKTEVSVNARYVFTITAVVQTMNEYGQPYSITPPPVINSFETSKPGKFADDAGNTITCQSNGTLERRILEAAGAKPAS